MERETFEKIADLFGFSKASTFSLYGSGHINETTLVAEPSGKRYILQKINTNLFTNVDALMNNIVRVTAYCRKKIAERGGNPDRETLTVVRTKDGKPFEWVDGGAYRVYDFLEDTTSYDLAPDEKTFGSSGEAFGRFTKDLKGFPAETLFEVLPDFHNTEKRFLDFTKAVERDACGRKKEVEKEIAFVYERKEYASRVTGLIRAGKLPLAVTHNDTKLNNVMFDKATGKAVCVIDLDTVMSGSILYDFGDSVRFGATTAAEDETDLDKVRFSLPHFQAYTENYLRGLQGEISETEAELLAFSGVLMTYECGMRFLTDYLSGDTYFRIKREKHNLDRARNQFRLVEEQEKAQNRAKDVAMTAYRRQTEK